MENISDYALAIISLLVFVLIVLLQAAMTGAAKAKVGATPGSTPKEDYENPLYRLNRSHQNGVENMSAAAIALFACILVGVASFWVNLLMLLFLLGRIAYVVVYSRSMGNPTQGIRTIVYVFSWAMLVILCVMAIWGLL
ncbi:MAPEG family protein [Falsihalocynthiibacter sp. SS001]|uniref:MAPEG family protein n=1 Tax=Falsihalocynthiibacter sp. SS001 TaxID=3349698 RepID=UPI0036D315F7